MVRSLSYYFLIFVLAYNSVYLFDHVFGKFEEKKPMQKNKLFDLYDYGNLDNCFDETNY